MGVVDKSISITEMNLIGNFAKAMNLNAKSTELSGKEIRKLISIVPQLKSQQISVLSERLKRQTERVRKLGTEYNRLKRYVTDSMEPSSVNRLNNSLKMSSDRLTKLSFVKFQSGKKFLEDLNLTTKNGSLDFKKLNTLINTLPEEKVRRLSQYMNEFKKYTKKSADEINGVNTKIAKTSGKTKKALTSIQQLSKSTTKLNNELLYTNFNKLAKGIPILRNLDIFTKNCVLSKNKLNKAFKGMSSEQIQSVTRHLNTLQRQTKKSITTPATDTKQLTDIQQLDKATGKFNNKMLSTSFEKFRRGVPILHGLNITGKKGEISIRKLNAEIKNMSPEKGQKILYQMNKFNSQVKTASSGQRQFNMDLLSGMFFFMSLSMALNSFLRPAREAVGVTQIWSDYMTILFLPAAMKTLDFVMWIGEALLWLTDSPHIPILSDLLNLAGVSDENLGSFFSSIINWGMLFVATLASIASMVFMTFLGAGGMSWAITQIHIALGVLNKYRLGRMIVSGLTGALDVAVMSARALKSGLLLIKNVSMALLIGDLKTVKALIRSCTIWTILFGNTSRVILATASLGWIGLGIAQGITFMTGITGALTLAGAIATLAAAILVPIGLAYVLRAALETNLWGIGEAVLWLVVKFDELLIVILKVAKAFKGFLGWDTSGLDDSITNVKNKIKITNLAIDKLKEDRGTLGDAWDFGIKDIKTDMMKLLGMDIEPEIKPKLVGEKTDWLGGNLEIIPKEVTERISKTERFPEDQYSMLPPKMGKTDFKLPEFSDEIYEPPEYKFDSSAYTAQIERLDELANSIEGKTHQEVTNIINKYEINTTNNNDISSDVDYERIQNEVDERYQQTLPRS